MNSLGVRDADACAWDLIALGEVMLRLDPGEGRIATAREFRAWEGGGEYNVARGLARCFGMRSAVATSFADNAVGRLIEDMVRQGGVDQSLVRWVPYDGIGRTVRNGLNFTERGFGLRAGLGVSDRANSAASQMKPTDLDWDDVFGTRGARWFHTGGIFAALSEGTPDVVLAAMSAARRHGTVISYDLNYRASLWTGIGGQERAAAVNGRLMENVDVLFGNEEDFSAALGFEVEGVDESLSGLDPASFGRMIERLVKAYPNLKVVATTLRVARTATRNDWGAVCWADGKLYEAVRRDDVEVLDRVGSGDSFASGLIYGLLMGYEPKLALEYGAAHGALAMTTPGDTSMATLADVEQVMRGAGARISR